jgi:hypothetical protein
MIDWINLAFNALWILGCAVALAALSYASWEATLLGVSLRSRLQQASYAKALNVSGFLVGLGAGGAVQGGWLKALWFVLAGMFLLQTVAALRSEQT